MDMNLPLTLTLLHNMLRVWLCQKPCLICTITRQKIQVWTAETQQGSSRMEGNIVSVLHCGVFVLIARTLQDPAQCWH